MSERRARAVAAQSLQGLAVVVRDHDAGVQREALAPGVQPLDTAHGRFAVVGRAPRRRRLGLDLCEHVDVLYAIVACLVGEPTRDPAHDAIEDRQHVGAGRHWMGREREPVVVIDEHAVGHEEVEVHVEVDRAPEPLHERDRPRRVPEHDRPIDQEPSRLAGRRFRMAPTDLGALRA